jgi:hypothetical protein
MFENFYFWTTIKSHLPFIKIISELNKPEVIII